MPLERKLRKAIGVMLSCSVLRARSGTKSKGEDSTSTREETKQSSSLDSLDQQLENYKQMILAVSDSSDEDQKPKAAQGASQAEQSQGQEEKKHHKKGRTPAAHKASYFKLASMPEPLDEPLATTEKGANRKQFKQAYTTAEIDFIAHDQSQEGTKSGTRFQGLKSSQKPPLQKPSQSNCKHRNTDV